MLCSNCNRKIPEDSLFCPYCGAPQSREAAKARDKAQAKVGAAKRYMYGLIIAEFVLIVILAIALANRPANSTTSPSSTPLALLSGIATYTPIVSVGTAVPAPASIKEVVAKEQDAGDFSVYMVLADQQGNMARGEGMATVDISDPNGGKVFSTFRTVKPENFFTIQGASGDSELIYSFGLIRYSDLTSQGPLDKSYNIHLTFAPTVGTPLTKDTTITLQ